MIEVSKFLSINGIRYFTDNLKNFISYYGK